MPLIEETDPSLTLLPSSDSNGERYFRLNDFSYPSHHWILQPLTFADSKLIALAFFQQSTYAVYLNPSDKRGYRSVVRLIDNNRMNSTINRNYSSSERIGLALTMSLVTEAYSRIVPIAQNAIAGNNAHSFDSNTGMTGLGNAEEPIFLHGHVFGRGNPSGNYIDDVPLDGPAPGLIFDMRAQTSNEFGNERKVFWKSDEVVKVARRIKTEIDEISSNYKVHGLNVFTENKFIDAIVVRHGQTDWNVERRLQGHTNTSLNDLGKAQAEALSEKLRQISFSKVFTSDLERAYSTAELILGAKNQLIIETSPLLRERSFGSWEGRLTVELQAYLKANFDVENMNRDEYFSLRWAEGVESYSDVFQRIETWSRSILLHSSTDDGQRPILVVSHGGVLRAILSHLNYQPGCRWEVGNAAFLKLRMFIDGQIVLTETEGVKLSKLTEIL